MSKPVRIRGDVVAQVQVVADGERRSLANMVEVLLLAALTERDQGRREVVAGLGAAVPDATLGSGSTAPLPSSGDSSPRSVSADVAAKVPGVTVGVRAHMRGDRHTLECSERVPAGQVCPKCGRHV